MAHTTNDRQMQWAQHGAAIRLQQIRAEMAEILRAFPQLRRQPVSARVGRPAAVMATAQPVRRRRMSKAWRAKLAAAAKRRWAAAKKAGRKRL